MLWSLVLIMQCFYYIQKRKQAKNDGENNREKSDQL